MTDFKKLVKNDSIYIEVSTKDFDAAKKFYTDVFGFETTWDGGAEVGWCQMDLPVPGVKLGINLLREGEVNPGTTMFYFDTDDIEALEKYLKEKGVETDPIVDMPDMVSILPFYDPDHNKLGAVAEARVKSQ
ncbi:MAG: VOC family protein [Candidatus Thorarchaeota archaeon]|jgi:predicted enzyme related to lactoylglutathione lyase